ncbi:amidohydrolase family protein [Nonomuraea sp. NPDC003201]
MRKKGRTVYNAPSPKSSRRDFLRGLSLAGVGAAAAGSTLPTFSTSAAHAERAAVTVLRRATVIDGTGARPLHGASVVIAGGWITWVGHDVGVSAHQGARVVDLHGKFVIPGLWDMHAHGSGQERIAPPLFVANGVTGIREMWGFPALHAVRDRIERGDLLGPRMVLASNIIDGPASLLGPLPTRVSAEADARQAVRAAKAEGADFIKIYSYLGRDTFPIVVDEARRQGLQVAGHTPYLLSVPEASDGGQRSFEHLLGITLSTSSREEEFRRRMADTPIDPAAPREWYNLVRDLERVAVESFDPNKARALFDLLKRNGTWQSPTLSVLHVVSQPAATYANDPRLRYIPALDQAAWADHLKQIAPVTPEQVTQQRRFCHALLRMVGQAHRAGVGVIGGTDCYNPYVFPGFSVHDELSLLVRAGLSPIAALQSMTRDAARYLGRADTVGTIAPGKVADLVVLDADPLADIRNTRAIHAVVTRGRLIMREEREKILADVEAAAKDPGATAVSLPACVCHGV